MIPLSSALKNLLVFFYYTALALHSVMFSRGTVPVHPEDEKILAIIRELCTQLNYYKLNIQTISWKGRIGVRRFPLDALMILPRFHVLQLSQQAMGRLSPEEWRPVLASGLLYYKNLTRKMLKTTLPIMGIALLMPIVIIADIKLLGGAPGALFDLVIIAFIFVLILSSVPLFLLQKRYFFENDAKAAQIVGKESLVSSLTKLASIDPNATTGKRGFFRPSIKERIQHLTTLSQY